jgi:hypothetical protein
VKDAAVAAIAMVDASLDELSRNMGTSLAGVVRPNFEADPIRAAPVRQFPHRLRRFN